MEIEANFQFGPLGVVFRFATGFLRGSFKGTQTTHLVHDPFRVQFGFQTLEGTVDRFAFLDTDFRHYFTYFLDPAGKTGGDKLGQPLILCQRFLFAQKE